MSRHSGATSPLSETRRTGQRRASRKLSFDGQTEGECAAAAGLCPSYTSPSVRRLQDLQSSQEDVRKPEESFIPPRNSIRRRRVQSLNAPFLAGGIHPVAAQPSRDLAWTEDHGSSLLTPPSVSLSHWSSFSSRLPHRDPTTTTTTKTTPASLVSPACESFSAGSSSRGSTPSLASPSVLPYRLAPTAGTANRSYGSPISGLWSGKPSNPSSVSCSLPATPAHRTDGPSIVSPLALLRRVDPGPSGLLSESAFSTEHSKADETSGVFRVPSAFHPTAPITSDPSVGNDAHDEAISGSFCSPSSAFVPTSSSAPSSSHKRDLPKICMSGGGGGGGGRRGGPLILGAQTEKVFPRMSSLRGRQVLPSPNSKAIRRICFQSPAQPEPPNDATNVVLTKPPPLHVRRNMPMLPLADAFVDGQPTNFSRGLVPANEPGYRPSSLSSSLPFTQLNPSQKSFSSEESAGPSCSAAASNHVVLTGNCSAAYNLATDTRGDLSLTEVDQFFEEFRRSLEEN